MLLFRRNTNTGVPDHKIQTDLVGAVHHPVHMQRNVTGVGELDGIAGQIDQHLLQSQGITHQAQIARGHTGHHQLQIFFAGVGGHDGCNIVEHIVQGKRLGLDFELARFNL